MYKMLRNGWTKHIDFMLWDMLCAAVAFSIAYFLRFDGVITPTFRNTFLLLLLADVLDSLFTKSYHNILSRGYLKELWATISHVIKVWFITLFLMFILKFDSVDLYLFSRLVLLYSIIIHIALVYAIRIWWKKVIVKYLKNVKSRALLLITKSDTAEKLVKTIKKNNLYGLYIIGIIIWDKDMTGKRITDKPVVASADEAINYICHSHVDEVFIDLHNQDIPNKFIYSCVQMGVAIHRPLFSDAVSESFVQKLAGYTVVTSAIHKIGSWQLFFKRLFDIIGGLIGSAVTFIMLPLIAIAIKSKSPGPVFYKQERVGKNGRVFKMYKFRTMIPNADSKKEELAKANEMGDDMMFKMENDPRIIPGIGSFLRKHSLDEFPQFFNVVKGDMSLVGTRPPTVDEWQKYLPNHRVRLSVRPGITGVWQVNGRNDITNFEDVVKLDEKYINEWSYGLDLRIILKTIASIFKGTGS